VLKNRGFLNKEELEEKIKNAVDPPLSPETLKETTENVISFLENRNFHNLPSLAIAFDGEVVLYWKDDDDYLELSFFGDGYFYLYCKIEEKEFFYDFIRVTENSFISKKCFEYFNRI